MLNVFTLVGKVKQMPQIKQTSQGNAVATLVIESERPFRNSDGSITFDLFNVTLWKGIAQMCSDCCKEGDVVAIKGRIQDTIYQKDKEHSYHNIELIAEKVSFIA